jgi:hypothetical protein
MYRLSWSRTLHSKFCPGAELTTLPHQGQHTVTNLLAKNCVASLNHRVMLSRPYRLALLGNRSDEAALPRLQSRTVSGWVVVLRQGPVLDCGFTKS